MADPIGAPRQIPPAQQPRGYVNPADIAGNTEAGPGGGQWSTFGDQYAGMTGADYSTIFGGDKQNYIDQFLGPNLQDPTFKKLLAKYGPAFQKYAFDMWKIGKVPTANELEYNFPGAKAFIGSSNGSGGGGGTSKAEQIANMEAEVRNQMATLGYNVVDSEVKSVAAQAVAEKWTSAKLTDILIGDTSKLVNKGSYSSLASQLKDMAMGQLVTIDDRTAQEWSRRMLSGELDMTTIQTILQQNALNEFGWAADALSTGATMRDILAPARDTVARELELNPNDVNLMDDKWRNMVQTTNTDGTKRAATLTEAVRSARKDGAYASTAGGARLAAQTGMMLRKVFEGS